jgi:hypothetical protein
MPPATRHIFIAFRLLFIFRRQQSTTTASPSAASVSAGFHLVLHTLLLPKCYFLISPLAAALFGVTPLHSFIYIYAAYTPEDVLRPSAIICLLTPHEERHSYITVRYYSCFAHLSSGAVNAYVFITRINIALRQKAILMSLSSIA